MARVRVAQIWPCAGCDEPCVGKPHAYLDPPTVGWFRRRRVCSAPCLGRGWSLTGPVLPRQGGQRNRSVPDLPELVDA